MTALKSTTIIKQIINGLLDTYKERVEAVSIILQGLVAHQIIDVPCDITNDHIAFRTLGIPALGIQSLEKVFLHHGYHKKDAYFFEQKRLNAYWYAPPTPDLPRIFISELIVTDMPVSVQEIIERYTACITQDPVLDLDLDDANAVIDFLHSSLWGVPSYEEYQLVSQHNEYAAWVLYNRYYLNHFTIDVTGLRAPLNTLAFFNQFVQEKLGVVLNDSGGVIKKSKDGLLLQSATVSSLCQATFSCGTQKDISASYVEFAQREVLPQFKHLPKDKITSVHRREGFEASNADKIFESTYTTQTNKKTDC